MANNSIVPTVIGTAFAAALTWFGTVTKMGFDNKAQLARLDERTQGMSVTIDKMDEKLDLLIGGPVQQAARAEAKE